MKRSMIKKFALAALVCGVLLTAKTNVSAEQVSIPDKDISYSNEDTISVGYAYKYSGGAGGYTYVNIGDGDKITNVKSSSANLLTKLTHYRYHISSDYVGYDEETYESKYERKTTYSSYYIAYFAKKAGKYTVTFDVVDKTGALKYQGSIKVNTYASSASKNPIKSIKYNGKDIWEYGPYIPKASGKLKVTMNKGFKFKKLEIGKYAYNGEYYDVKYKTAKNNKKISLATKDYRSRKYSDTMWEEDTLFPDTMIRITYQTKSKQIETTTYWVSTLNTKSSIKN